jgi:hypothetical protein
VTHTDLLTAVESYIVSIDSNDPDFAQQYRDSFAGGLTARILEAYAQSNVPASDFEEIAAKVESPPAEILEAIENKCPLIFEIGDQNRITATQRQLHLKTYLRAQKLLQAVPPA